MDFIGNGINKEVGAVVVCYNPDADELADTLLAVSLQVGKLL